MSIDKKFKDNTKSYEQNGRFCIDCKKGNWGVSAPSDQEAKREAFHYFMQYNADGEYDD